MMTFTANGKTYKASVSYEKTLSLYPVRGEYVPARATTVKIGEVKENGEIDWITIGASMCHPKDNFVKAIGRHEAAKFAVQYAYAMGEVEPTQDFAKAVLALFPSTKTA